MKICFFSPYIPKHTGGGEKYIFDCVRALKDEHQVYLAISDREMSADELQHKERSIRQRYEDFLGYSLEGVKFMVTPLGGSANWWQTLVWTKQWDVMYYLTDGSIFLSMAARNILHIQFPLKLDKSSWWEQFKLKSWQVKNTNSKFTKKIIEKYWNVKIDEVHYPVAGLNTPVKEDVLAEKQPIIINVGRFFRQLHTKRQDLLVEMFKVLLKRFPDQLKGWKLVLIGSSEDQGYAAAVEKAAVGLPIKIIHDCSRLDLEKWYRKASIYWHATGFGIDDEAEPEKVEHFGITTAEAMRSGCVPIVLGKGGQLEVLGSKLKDLSWQTLAEGVETTQKMVGNESLRKKKAKLAMEQAQFFGRSHFEKTLKKMIKDV